uniref:Uncharacterized protein n=1 Tax=Lepeophtheirus salmonis TaxID=72036 RepID=A0A0K2V8U2_LEPSM
MWRPNASNRNPLDYYVWRTVERKAKRPLPQQRGGNEG